MKRIPTRDMKGDNVLGMEAIVHVEAGGRITWPKVGSVERDPIAETSFVMTPVKGKPRYHKSAVKVLEYLYLASGSKVTTC